MTVQTSAVDAGLPLRYAREYLLDAPGVFVPDAFAWWLSVHTNLEQVRKALRGAGDRCIDEFLLALKTAAARFPGPSSGDGTNGGTKVAVTAEPAAPLTRGIHVSAREAADLVGVTDRAIRRAVAERRLPASKDRAGHWRVTRDDLAEYAKRCRRSA